MDGEYQNHGEVEPGASPHKRLSVGTRVRVVHGFSRLIGKRGILYAVLPDRKWPYHVRLDGRTEGFAFAPGEIEPIEEGRA